MLGALSGCSDSDGDPDPDDANRASTTATDLSDATLWLSFESRKLTYGGRTSFADALGGPHSGLVVTANRGAVDIVEGVDGSGDAISFPGKCEAASDCPRAMVEVRPDAAFDPGTSDFEFGAAVWLAPDQTTTGSNIVQRGRFGSEGGLWKLQVDSVEGRPSCVIRSEDEEPLNVRSTISVADSSWHRVVCRRDATGIEIEVDGEVERTDGATGSVDSQWPIRIGSPGVGDEDDQFHGRIDDVFLSISPSS